jgi:hypothetical protein
MIAIIQYLEDEEAGEGEGEEEEEGTSFDNTGDKFKIPVNILNTLSLFKIYSLLSYTQEIQF